MDCVNLNASICFFHEMQFGFKVSAPTNSFEDSVARKEQY